MRLFYGGLEGVKIVTVLGFRVLRRVISLDRARTTNHHDDDEYSIPLGTAVHPPEARPKLAIPTLPC